MDQTKKAPYVRSTASLNTAEFTDYIEKIRNFVAQWVYIPTPEEWKKAN
nr:MAG TPA: protein NinB [Caudoviricetes sp.]